MRRLLLVLALLLAGSPLVFAQEVVDPPSDLPAVRTLPRPYVTHVVTKEELIQGCMTNDKKVMNVSCKQYMQDVTHAAQTMGFKGDDGKPLSFKNLDQFLEYLGNLSVEVAPQGRAIVFGRVLPGGEGELGKFSRIPHPGEKCLYDGNNGGCVISLQCGNMYGTHVQVFRSSDTEGGEKPAALAPVSKPTVEPAPPAPTPVEVRLDPDQVAQAVRAALEKERGRQSSSSPTSASFLSPKRPGFWIVTGVVVIGGTALALLARPSATATSCAYVGVNATGGCAVK